MARRPEPLILSIAGSDPTAGAGLQADIRTFEHLGVASASVVTAITVQNGREVSEVVPLRPALVERQLVTVLASLPVTVVKCGMFARAASAAAVARVLAGYHGLAVVVDPVIKASGGEQLGDDRLLKALVRHIFPLTRILTANLAEAEALVGAAVADTAAMATAARRIATMGPGAVVIKGGHLHGDPVDVLWDGRRIRRFQSARVDGADLHGSGCAFASAVAVGLARRHSLARSVADAGAHVRALIRCSRPLGGGVSLRRPLS